MNLEPLQLASRMHATPCMVVYEFAGAGSLALHWLHAAAGSSRTVLEAVDRYAAASLGDAVGEVTGQAASPEVAQRLARHALERARALAPAGIPVIGVGCTAAIATDRAKRGEHRVCIAVAGTLGRHAVNVTLRKGLRDRDGEERLASTLVLQAAATGCGVLHRSTSALHDDETLRESFVSAPPLAELSSGERRQLVLTPEGELHERLPWPGGDIAIVSGSFNPLHDGHLGLAAAAREHLGRPAVFELSIRNAEKPSIEPIEVYRRAAQFQGHERLLLTGEPLFSHKAALYPGAVFVLGVDTAARVLSPRYYPGDHDLDTSLGLVGANGCRFLVAGRRTRLPSTVGAEGEEERFMTLADLDVPDRYADLFEALPESTFRSDVSSSAIRERSSDAGEQA